MGRPKGAHDDDAKWPERNENAFLEILRKKFKDEQDGKLSLNLSNFKEIDEELFLATGIRYGYQKLKGKFSRLRIKHACFTELIAHEDVTYDSKLNIVFAHQDVWQMFCKKNSKVFKAFQSAGCKNYGLLDQVFGKSRASVQSSDASPQLPTNLDDDCQNEDEFSEGLADVTGVGKSYAGSCKQKRDNDIVLCPRGEKEPRSDKLDASSSAKTKKDRANAKRRRLQGTRGTDSEGDPYSITECMEVLEMEDDVSDAAYSKALEKFVNRDWRIIFMSMSERRRKAWLQNL